MPVGAFKSTFQALGGLVWKRRFKLTSTQKTRQRKRLKAVDNRVAKRAPLEHEMTPREKYWVEAKRFKHGMKPVSWVPKWTRVPHPRKWSPTFIHAPVRMGRSPNKIISPKKIQQEDIEKKI
ncbi:hypothetical protein HK099_007754 [Clydaea vesicula]|uniref:Uncharacterized protein n=1 Tax=Clydaea vesicula TaxID=447962 RepID=A0AAD5U0W5_9FUNG|nr:hypothetical protein HK099_007754 [Clydaea vesicula]